MKRFVFIFTTMITFSSYAEDSLLSQAQALYSPLPASMHGSEQDSPALIQLGEKLFHEPKLSINNTQSCNSCHNVNNQGPGVDNQITSTGALGEKGGRNTPTVWNAGFQASQFWDGRAENLVSQAHGPILNPVEMAMPNASSLETKLQEIPEYVALFEDAFASKDAITFNNIALAIAAFERTLITRDRFDDYLRGNENALTEIEKKGLTTFITTGCASCHSGSTLGGSFYMKMGLMNPYSNQSDLGRFDISQQENDKMMFKVAMLRDIARTAPYFHDGKIATLTEAVKQMAFLQLNKDISDEDTVAIVAFLNALTHQGTNQTSQETPEK